MAHGDIKIWRLTPAQIEAYKPGVDLGQPHEIKKPERTRWGLADEAAKVQQRKRATKSRLKGL